jgi:hypothetical protein
MGDFKPYPGLNGLIWEAVEPQFDDIADDALGVAQAIAPVLTGDYRDSIRVYKRPRARRLQANDWKSELLEFGTRKMRAYRTILIAAQTAREGQ